MTQTKLILKDIMNAFCLSTQNLRRVHDLSGIGGNLYNGKRTNDKLRDILLRVIPEEKAKEIINKMGFPFIEEYYGVEGTKNIIDSMHSDTGIKWEDYLVPLERKRGYRMENVTKGSAIFYR